MTSLQPMTGAPVTRPALAGQDQAKAIYDALMQPNADVEACGAVAFLNQQLTQAEHAPCDLPQRPEQLEDWIAGSVSAVAEQYAAYLASRHAGEPRRFFSNKSHAMYFLQHVAPTKLVDGAWLFGLLPHWADYRFHGLVRTYLEELGDGDPALNHVSLYRKLLADLDCDPGDTLPDERYLQGAIQLCLGMNAAPLLPEVIGYNLGYEQLPLHLMITSFELNELGIDPYYFTLHVTIDNASTGHARKAAQSVLALLPMGPERDEFYHRVAQGYRLNELGEGTTAVIQSFDLEQQVIDMLERKRTFGQHMHSDYCRLDGKTVNEWLSTPDQIPAFLAVLQNRGWIKRHQDPADSRFWQLIEGAGAPMFGIFSGYEKQLLSDWISGDWQPVQANQPKKAAANAFRARFRKTATAQLPAQQPLSDTDPDVQNLSRQLAEADPSSTMPLLIEHLSPARHPTPAGLQATRLFVNNMAERMKGQHA
ncbi:iron-containing redox enzyme family protein [Xanthomonas sp. WHRI 1810A]|uniref:iron-containing redox enzyme family protein n=1 Tax=Xanthomonas sp. WHRI 1810A TaxID=3161565 RepID=UPI0032E8DA36